MKTLVSFLCLLAFQLNAQTGSVLLKCIDNQTKTGIVGLKIEFLIDSTISTAYTENAGLVFQKNLSPGLVKFRLITQDTLSGSVFIQTDQLAQLTLFVDIKQNAIYPSSIGNSIQFDPAGNVSRQINNPFPINSNAIKEIQCVQIVAYSYPLISRDAGAVGVTITRDDIARLPVRSANGIATTVGGVQSPRTDDQLHFRGSRSDANAYYLDGMRISNGEGIPKAYMSNVSVYTGGIPANYGDLTGGVISISSVNYTNLELDRGSRSRKHLKRIVSEPEDEQPKPVVKHLNYDQFLPIYENDFLSPLDHPHSTFGLDVDRASWSFIKRQMAMGGMISRDAVKIEEMINSFETKKLVVQEDALLQVDLSKVNCSWNPQHQLVTVHLKAKDLPKDLPRKTHNLVFLIDVSGSMNQLDRLTLLIMGLKRFVKTLDEKDRVAIVTYAGYSAVVLESTKCSQQDKILEALDQLVSGGSTNGIGGIMEAYNLAEKNFNSEFNNRIILCTDGDFNVGINSPGDLEKFIEEKRGLGIYLTALGFGMGNYKNATLETLADKGDGNHFYIRDLNDMHKVLVEDIGNIMNIARDVKLNVEFNPELVKTYRLIGYENRLLKPKDFEDDTKDGGEIGYNHSVTAVYEIELGKAEKVETHFSGNSNAKDLNELAFVKLRYKPFEQQVSIEQRFSLTTAEPTEENLLLNLIIGLGLHLRDSAFKGDLTINMLQNLAKDFSPKTEDEFELKRIILSL